MANAAMMNRGALFSGCVGCSVSAGCDARRLQADIEWLSFFLIQLDLTPRQARRWYRRRFGIESSYHCAGQARGWTTSPNAAYRFVLLASSFILLIVWIRLRWLFRQIPHRSRCWLDTKRFRLRR
jgi:hypothetical protein